MADNFLERHRRDYEARKAAWLSKRKAHPVRSKSRPQRGIARPDDESL